MPCRPVWRITQRFRHAKRGFTNVPDAEKGLMQQPTAICAQTAKVSPWSLSQMAVEMSGAVRCRAAVLRAAQCFTESKLPRAHSRTWLERRQKKSCRVPMHAHGFQEWLHVLVTSWANNKAAVAGPAERYLAFETPYPYLDMFAE